MREGLNNRKSEETDGADLLERILSRGNLNRAYKRVKANKGAPGIDGMAVEDALPWLREYREELLDQMRSGKYKPQAVRRKEIPKPDGGIRKLGIPTAVDRIIQQAIAQQLTPIFEPLFSDYFYKPVLWAVSRGITNGTSATTFGPYNTCTRAQAMTFMYRA